MNNLEKGSTGIMKQREVLSEKNPDKVYGVYEVVSDENGVLEFNVPEDIMTTYKNQYDKLDISESPDIKILDLGELRKGKISYLKGNGREDKNYTLLSNGVIDYITSSKGRQHIITTLRDGGGLDSLQYTTTAGRNEGKNLQEELERELYEEAPFLGKDEKGNYTLAIPEGNNEGWEYTKEALKYFLETKYNLDKNNEVDTEFIKYFERSFPGIKYEQLGKVLEDIIKNNRFVNYGWQNGNIDALENDMKKLKIGENEIEAYVFFDEKNNTYEYRGIREIKGFPEGFQLLGKKPCRLFLESQNQYPRMSRIEDTYKLNVVPTISEVSQKVAQFIEEKI